jgi:hypothetical protein
MYLLQANSHAKDILCCYLSFQIHTSALLLCTDFNHYSTLIT